MQSDAAQSSGKQRSRRRGLSFEVKMMIPALVILAAISILPLIYIIWMSLHNVTLLGGSGIESNWTGLDNWGRMFTDSNVWSGWLAMIIYFVATVGLEMVLGLVIALVIHEVAWGKNLALSLVLIPMFIAPVIVGLLGRFLVNPTYGLYAWVLRESGLYDGNILGGSVSAFVAVVLMDVWEWTPLVVLITLAGLVSIQPQVLEAARVDGANYFERLRHIVLPSITGIVIVALLIRSMDALRYFDIIWQATNGGPANATKIIPLRLYESAFRFFHLGYAATIGLLMLAVSILVANLFTGILRQRGLLK
ncbi:MAG TPA: sugar ABC transporter permease [Rubrobacter sp.]|nr:sugar ABC transporter permease [Rubrobacter sp.]